MTKILVIRGLGRAPVKRARPVKGRSAREADALRVQADADAEESTARGMARKRVRADCTTRVRQVRRRGRARVEAARADGTAAIEDASAECDAARVESSNRKRRARGMPRSERRREERDAAEHARDVCARVPVVRREVRDALAELRAERREDNERARLRCVQTRETVAPLLARFLAQREARRAEELRRVREEHADPQTLRTARQQIADRQRARSMRGKRRGSAPTMQEAAELAEADIAPQWVWLWRRLAPRFLRSARQRNASPAELFYGYLHDHGVRDPDTTNPGGTEFGDDYERHLERLADAERLERDLQELDSLGITREAAMRMIRDQRASAARAARRAPAKPPPRDDDGIPF